MKVKKFVARTMPEIMKQIKKELGPDAVILQSKQVRHGKFFGLMKKTNIEVIAALDPEPITAKTPEPVHEPQPRKVANEKKDESNDDVLAEIRHLKKLIELQSSTTKNIFTMDYHILYQHLISQEVEPDLAGNIVASIVKQHEVQENAPEIRQIFQDAQIEIENRLKELTFEGITYAKRVIHFVGPTGVGKTTTIAKVAAASMLNDRKKTAFITADTYRIAAIEQLKTYARILDIPIEVAYNVDDYQAAIEKFSDYDLILVDTAGRNFRDEKYVQELKSTIQFKNDVETYLVLSLTAKAKDIHEVYDQFRPIPIKETIFTKLDETRQYGSMLNIALNKGIGIAYMTNGQNVPDDLLKPSPEEISKLIVGEDGDT